MMLTPMTMQEMISLAPDAMINSLSFAFIAYVLDCAFRKERVSDIDILVIGLMLSVMALCKIVYVVIFLLIYIIPREKIERRSSIIVLRIILPILCIIVNLAWLRIASTFLIEFTPGVNSGEQVRFIFHNPLSYIVIFIKTILKYGWDWCRCMFGDSLGWLNIGTSFIVWLSFLLLFAVETVTCRVYIGEKKTSVFLFLLVFISGSVLILTSLYVKWTKVGNEIIEGVQGRYFIPLMSFLSLFFVLQRSLPAESMEKELKNNSHCHVVIVLFLNFMALVDVIKFYPENSFNNNVFITAKYSKEYNLIEIRMKRIKPYTEMKVAVWSLENGQDDIVWFPIRNTEHQKEMTYSVPLKNFSTNGSYDLHLWSFEGDEAKTFIASTKIDGVVIKK